MFTKDEDDPENIGKLIDGDLKEIAYLPAAKLSVRLWRQRFRLDSSAAAV